MNFARAGFGHRMLANAVDMVVPAVVAATSAWFVASVSYEPPVGWFWSEWLLKIWLDHPAQLLVPVGVFIALWLAISFVAEGLTSKTPGARTLGLEVVTSRGRPIAWKHATLRMLGGVLNVLLLGFASMWSLADPEGRTLQDRISGTWVVVRKTS